jgi:uncharacterized protein YkwD
MEVPTVRTSPLFRTAAALALAVVAALVAGAPAQASRTDCTPEAAWPRQDAGLAAQVVALVNQHRASLGLSQLGVSQSLTNAAAWKAAELGYDVGTVGAGAFSHEDWSTGRTPQQRLQACGWSANFGENIALGQDSPQAVMTAWLNSAGHRRNLENPGWVSIGVGAAPGGAEGIGWVQEFGDQLPDPIQQSIASLAPLAPAPTAPTLGVPLAPPLEAPVVAAQGVATAPAPAAAAPALSVRIVDRPRSRTRRRTARIRWVVSGPVQGVSCSLNGRALRRCGFTGRTLKHMPRGRHVFRITASGPAGPVTRMVRWRVLRG